MSTFVQVRYNPVPIGVNGSFTFPQGAAGASGGFLCITAGTLTATRADGSISINAYPLTAGTFTPLPFFHGPGTTITLAGGASGTLAVA